MASASGTPTSTGTAVPTSSATGTPTPTASNRQDAFHNSSVLVLRAGSNYTMPPPGVPAADYLLRENQGYAGMHAALENLVTVGGAVVDRLLDHWDRYARTPPQ